MVLEHILGSSDIHGLQLGLLSYLRWLKLRLNSKLLRLKLILLSDLHLLELGLHSDLFGGDWGLIVKILLVSHIWSVNCLSLYLRLIRLLIYDVVLLHGTENLTASVGARRCWLVVLNSTGRSNRKSLLLNWWWLLKLQDRLQLVWQRLWLKAFYGC